MIKLGFLVLTIAIVFASNAYIYPFTEVPQTELDRLTQSQIAQLIKYNMGLSENAQAEQFESFKEMISTYGKGNMLSPTNMNYLILIESENLFAAQEGKQQRITEGFTASMKVLERNEKGVMDLLFGQEDSMVSKAEKLFRDQNLPFMIYQNEDDLDIQYLQWTITLTLGKNTEVFLYEPKRDKSYKMEKSLESCVDFFFGSTFDYAPKEGKVYKYNTNEMIEITKENHDLFLEFFKDICAMNKLSQIFKQGNSPNFLTIINKSIAKLEKVLKDDEIDFVYDMMRIAHKRLSKNFKNYFDNDELFGMILVEEEKNPEIITTREAAKIQRILMETRNRMLDQTSVSAGTSAAIMTAGTYQIYVWFGIFFVFVLFGVLYSMLTMDIQKDTLLYAKFLTTDQRN